MIGNTLLMKLICDGVIWYYQSYDHKAAVKDMLASNNHYYMESFNRTHDMYVPNDVQEKHRIWRTGKLWTVRFDPDGIVSKIYVGHYLKYAKCFFPRSDR